MMSGDEFYDDDVTSGPATDDLSRLPWTGADSPAPFGGAAFHDNKVWLRRA